MAASPDTPHTLWNSSSVATESLSESAARPRALQDFLAYLASFTVEQQLQLVAQQYEKRGLQFRTTSLDGLAGAGKSTTVAQIAERFKLEPFSNGLVFRSIACFLMQRYPADAAKWKDTPEEQRVDILSRLLAELKEVRPDGDGAVLVSESAQLQLDRQALRSEQVEEILPYLSNLQPATAFVAGQLRRSVVLGTVGVIDGRDTIETLERSLLAETARMLGGAVAQVPEVCLAYMYATQEAMMARKLAAAGEWSTIQHLEQYAAEVAATQERNEREQARKRGRVLTPLEAWNSEEYSLVLNTSKLSIAEGVLAVVLSSFGATQEEVAAHLGLADRAQELSNLSN